MTDENRKKSVKRTVIILFAIAFMFYFAFILMATTKA